MTPNPRPIEDRMSKEEIAWSHYWQLMVSYKHARYEMRKFDVGNHGRSLG
jgi:hypothetical protein